MAFDCVLREFFLCKELKIYIIRCSFSIIKVTMFVITWYFIIEEAIYSFSIISFSQDSEY